MLTHTLKLFFFFPKKFKCNLLEEVGEHRVWIEQKYVV